MTPETRMDILGQTVDHLEKKNADYKSLCLLNRVLQRVLPVTLYRLLPTVRTPESVINNSVNVSAEEEALIKFSMLIEAGADALLLTLGDRRDENLPLFLRAGAVLRERAWWKLWGRKHPVIYLLMPELEYALKLSDTSYSAVRITRHWEDVEDTITSLGRAVRMSGVDAVGDDSNVREFKRQSGV